MANEFNSPIRLSRLDYQVARRTDAAGAAALAGMRGVEVLQRSDGTHLALFADQWRAKVTARDNPEIMLEALPAGGCLASSQPPLIRRCPQAHGAHPGDTSSLPELDAVLDDETLLARLRRAPTAPRAVPGLVGVSMASRDQGVTFTRGDRQEIAVSSRPVRLHGPCSTPWTSATASPPPPVGCSTRSAADFARASAAAGIHSTLPCPSSTATVVGRQLYGRDEDTFVDRHEALAEIFGAWAPGAVADADLSFTTPDCRPAGAGADPAGRHGGHRCRDARGRARHHRRARPHPARRCGAPRRRPGRDARRRGRQGAPSR